MLKTLLIIVLVLLGLRLLGRLLAPYLLKALSKKIQRRFEQNFQNFQTSGQAPQPEGSVHVHKTKSQVKSSNSEVGDYIDYEEID